MLNKFPNLTCDCFNSLPTLINGIPVSAETLQPILEALYANDVFLKSVLDYFDMPSALMRCVEVDYDALVGQPVYYSEDTQRFELARYASTTSESGQIYLEETAEVWGIIREKPTADTALILICGMSTVDLTESIDVLPASGKYYLSDVAGMLSPIPPDDVAPVYVLSATADGNVLFRPWSGEYAGLVLQWKHELLPVAAGTPSTADGEVTIGSPNNELPGWLPAGNAIFGGNAPVGAVFGYNIAADEVLEVKWPPRFLNTVHLDLDRGLDPNIGGTSVPLGANGLAIIDANGIWWMNGCEDDTPFDPAQFAGTDVGDCPRQSPKRLTMYAARPAGIAASDNLTMSLRATHPSLRVVRRDTTSLATTGDLDILLDVAQLITTQLDDDYGYAVKRADNGRLTRGPVVTAIRSTSPQFVISSSSSYGIDGQYKHGEIMINSTGVTTPELYPMTTALVRAEEEVVYGTLGIGLPTVRDSSFRSKFIVPAGIGGTATVSFRVWIMGHFPNSNSVSITTEQLTLSVKILPPPGPSTNVAVLSETAVTLPVSPVENGKVFQQTSSTFTVAAGSIVYAELARTPGNAAYEMHALNHHLYIESVSGV